MIDVSGVKCMKWDVSGKIRLGRGERKFTKNVEADTENAARERTYALFGSLNGVKRSKIDIERVEKSGG
jgi:ribosomal protein L20A (L18A)